MKVKVSGHLNVSQRSLRTAIPLPYLFSSSSNVGWKKKNIHTFVLLFQWTTEYGQDPVNPYLRQRFLPIDQALAKRANLPGEQLWRVAFSFFAVRLNSDLLSSPPRIAAQLHFCFPPINSISCKNFGESVTLTSTKCRGEDSMKNFTDPGQQKSLPRTQGEILIDMFVWAAFVQVGFLLKYVVKDWYTGQ